MHKFSSAIPSMQKYGVSDFNAKIESKSQLETRPRKQNGIASYRTQKTPKMEFRSNPEQPKNGKQNCCDGTPEYVPSGIQPQKGKEKNKGNASASFRFAAYVRPK